MNKIRFSFVMTGLFFVSGLFAGTSLSEEFSSWHRRRPSREILNRKVSRVIRLAPGMSSLSQLIPENIRNFLLKNFKKYSLSEDEWKKRWRLVEGKILEISGAYDVLDVLVVMEDLGREAFSRMKTEQGLFFENIPSLKGALAYRFFLMSDRKRQEEFSGILRSIILSDHRDGRRFKEIMLEHGLKERLQEKNFEMIVFFLMRLNARVDLIKENRRDVFVERFDREKKYFEEKMGFKMPSATTLYQILFDFQIENKKKPHWNRGNFK
jgi:hypothetical protein